MCCLRVPSMEASVQILEQGMGLAVVHPMALLDGSQPDGLCQMAFAAAGGLAQRCRILQSALRSCPNPRHDLRSVAVGSASLGLLACSSSGVAPGHDRGGCGAFCSLGFR